MVSVGPGALPFPSRDRVCWKALEPAPPPLLRSPGYKRRGCPARVLLYSAPPNHVFLASEPGMALRDSAMSTTGPGWGTRPERVRQPQPPPGQRQTGWSRPCSPEPWPTSWGCSEPYCTFLFPVPLPTTHFPFKKKENKTRGEGLEERGEEARALLPTLLPPSGPQRSQ